MSDYKIDNHVELPVARTSGKHFPFAQMKVGDSFAVPNLTKNTRITVYNHARKFMTKHQPTWEFTTRTVDDSAHIRVWRTK